MSTEEKINPEPNDVATLKRDDVKRAYVLLGLDPEAWDYTSAITINPAAVIVERHTTSPSTLDPDGNVETMISTVKIEG